MKRMFAFLVLAAGCASPHPDRELAGIETKRRDPAGTESRPAPQESLRGLTLDRALAFAEEAHPELAEARTRVEAAAGRFDQAGLWSNPLAILRMESARFNGGTTSDADFLAGFSFPLPLGGRLGAAERIAEFERLRALHQYESMRLEVRARVHGAFATALYGREVENLRGEIRKAADNAVAVTKARVDAGDALPEELDRVEMEQVRSRIDFEQAAETRELAYLGLAAAMGDPSLRIESVEGTLDAVLEIPRLHALVEAVGRSPLVAAADADVGAQRGRIELAEVERIPDLNVDLLYRRIGADDADGFDVGVSASLPLFDRNQGKIREARADLAGAEARARMTRNEVSRRVRETYARLTRSLARATLLKKEMVPRAESVLRTAEVRYGAGDVGLSEVLPIRRDRANVRLANLQALRDVMESWAALKPFLREE
ncbi:MAG: TolC family protein [Planctomycetes bacterium]|nr:TolC family protein [Planctomycetota bacterium]